ncbi:hypothetical protein MMC16_006962 [Acarospora aff. strigata]|nr:hypothetical protein [Acarospora aff. strigata]
MASALPGCVASLQSSIQLLSSSISILDSGVNDFPRLAKVLHTTRHFELLPEPTLHSAQTSLLAEITPEVESLLARVETQLDKMERRERALVAKAELQQGRLGDLHQHQHQGRGRDSNGKGDSGARNGNGNGHGSWGGKEDTGAKEKGEAEAGMEALRVKYMRQKKERLSYAVERLTLQAQQRERQLRMSMAAQ